MKEKAAALLCLIHKVLREANLSSRNRSIEILKESLAATEGHLQSAGHRAGAKRILASQSATGLVAELRAGVSYRDNVFQLLDEVRGEKRKKR